MEEKIIDLETGKTIRFRKNADGENEIVDGNEPETEQDEEEIVFDLPEQDEDDEELASLTPEEAEAFKRAREEKQREIEEKGRAYLAQANELFAEGKKEEAEEAFREAEEYLGEEPEVIVGILRTATDDFTSVDRVGELRDELDALRLAEIGAREAFLLSHGDAIGATLESIRAEKTPLQEKVEAKRKERDGKFRAGFKVAAKHLLVSSSLTVVMVILAVVFITNIFHQSGSGFLILAIASGVLACVGLAFTLIYANQFLTAKHRLEMNADNAYSNDGRRLNALIEQEEFYDELSRIVTDEGESE